MDDTTNALVDLRAAVAAYDSALRADDIDTLNTCFDPEPTTSRFAERGAIRGAQQIDEMRRKQRPGIASGRVDGRADYWLIAPGAAVATLEFTRSDGSRGLRTQVWKATDGGWKITHAHLSTVT